MIPHRRLARVAVVAGVNAMAYHLSARVAVSSSMVVAEVVGADRVVLLSAHVEDEVVLHDVLLAGVGEGEDGEGVRKIVMGCTSMYSLALPC